MLAGHFFDSFGQRMSADQFGPFLSRVLSQGATDIREGVLVVLSRTLPIGGYRQRKRQQLFLQYGVGVGVQVELMVVVVVVQASLVDGMMDSHNCRDVYCY